MVGDLRFFRDFFLLRLRLLLLLFDLGEEEGDAGDIEISQSTGGGVVIGVDDEEEVTSLLAAPLLAAELCEHEEDEDKDMTEIESSSEMSAVRHAVEAVDRTE